MHHYETLKEESERISMENRQLNSFFMMTGEESKLAMKMKKRIEELRDSLLDFKRRNKNPRASKLTKIVDQTRFQLNILQ